MDAHRAFHRRLLDKRQGLGGVLGSIFPFNSALTPTASPAPLPSPNSLGILGGITSLVGNLPSPVSQPPAPLPTTTSSTPSPSSTSSTTTLSPAVQPIPSSSSTTSSTPSTTQPSPTTTTTTTITPTTTTTTTPTPTPTTTSAIPPNAATANDIVYTSTEGTQVVYITSTLPAPSATGSPHLSFLQNPSLEGGVFALVGIVVLIIVFITVTWTIRRRHRRRLERDLAVAVTFDPGATEQYDRQEESIDKQRLSASSSGHGHGWAGFASYPVQQPYPSQPEYHGAVCYPAPVYRTPSPGSVPYPSSSPVLQQPAGQGGANLTRKFSDRKPVPPLLPHPAYDPVANGHVSIPPQFYQQQQ